MIQLSIAVFGLTSMWMALGNNAPLRKWAPIFGLVGQPFWLYRMSTSGRCDSSTRTGTNSELRTVMTS